MDEFHPHPDFMPSYCGNYRYVVHAGLTVCLGCKSYRFFPFSNAFTFVYSMVSHWSPGSEESQDCDSNDVPALYLHGMLGLDVVSTVRASSCCGCI